mmetsp:Transcript_5654/g.12612  ORF Transcript_5654/g.12612 Transcript_5654/m.12612 type:complete len:396 (+) Transcript_5654:338-1525(+)
MKECTVDVPKPSVSDEQSRPVKRGGSIRHVGVVIVFFVLTVVNWFVVELPRGLSNPARLGSNGVNIISNFVCIWCLVLACEQYMLMSTRGFALLYQGYTEVQRRKILVYLVEISWGTLSFAVMVWVLIRIYVLNLPYGCTDDIASMDVSIDVTYATLANIFPRQVQEGPITLATVNPGTDVTFLSTQDTLNLQKISETCFAKNSYGLYSSCTMIFGMYTVELALLGSHMRKSLMLHHFSSFLIVFLLLESPLSSAMVLPCIPHILMAVLEQPTFLALAIYRLFPQAKRAHKVLFCAGWVSFGLFKFLACAVSIYFFGKYWKFYTVTFQSIFTLSMILLLFTQAWSTYAQFMVWKKIGSKTRTKTKQNQFQMGPEDSEGSKSVIKSASRQSPEGVV